MTPQLGCRTGTAQKSMHSLHTQHAKMLHAWVNAQSERPACTSTVGMVLTVQATEWKNLPRSSANGPRHGSSDGLPHSMVVHGGL